VASSDVAIVAARAGPQSVGKRMMHNKEQFSRRITNSEYKIMV